VQRLQRQSAVFDVRRAVRLSMGTGPGNPYAIAERLREPVDRAHGPAGRAGQTRSGLRTLDPSGTLNSFVMAVLALNLGGTTVGDGVVLGLVVWAASSSAT
jgi:hypothetical protein